MIKTILSIAALAIGLAACKPAADSVPAKPSAIATPKPASVYVGGLVDSDYAIQGCTTLLSRAGGSGADIFAEDGGDKGAKGYIKINGKVVPVTLAQGTSDDHGGNRQFVSSDGKVQIVETYVIGKQNPDTDSVELSGSVKVIVDGAAQDIRVQGGTAC